MKYKESFILSFLLISVFIVTGCSSGENSGKNSERGIQADQPYTERIDQLIEDDKISEALSFIEVTDNQTIEDQIILTEIPAPPFMEEERSLKFAQMLKVYGADSVWTDAVGNAIGLRRGTSGESVLAVAAHLDTVFPEGTDVTVKTVGDTLFAPGISDDVRGLASVLTILRTMEQVGLRTKDDLLIIGNVGEEGLGDLRGMKHLFREDGPRIDAFISIDGSNEKNVTHRALGSHRYRVTYEGPGGHSWGAFGLGNPHHALGRAISTFVDAADEYTSNDGPKTSYNIGRISGGTSVNSIPFESWMEVDMRSISPERLGEIDDILQESVQKALDSQNNIRREGPEITLDIEMIGKRPSGETDVEEPIVQYSIAATEYFENEPNLRISSTDSNIPISLGIPAVTLGGGGTNGESHSLDEWYVNDKGYEGIQRILLVITGVAGIEK